jgi:hypothetical protein
MANFALTRADVFPPGSTVDAFAAEDWNNEMVVTSAAPPVANEVQTVEITGSPEGGDFTLAYEAETDPIAFDAEAADVQAALEGLESIEEGDVDCTGGPLPETAVVVTFTGQLAQTDVSVMTANDSGLTGGTSPAVVITTSGEGFGPVQTETMGDESLTFGGLLAPKGYVAYAEVGGQPRYIFFWTTPSDD